MILIRFTHSAAPDYEIYHFYSDPVGYIQTIDSDITHLVFFGEALKQRYLCAEGERKVCEHGKGELFRSHVEDAGWDEVWSTTLNGFDIFQDDESRRGGLHVFERGRRGDSGIKLD